MEFSTVILRFRDLVTEKDATIGRHKEIIKNKNYVWWGWWNKGNERVPYDEFSVMRGRIDETLDLYLIDSGQRKLYKAQCCGIKYSDDEKMKSPEIDHTPDYYNKQGKKPNARILREICDNEHVSIEQTIYIGDSLSKDMLMAKQAGILSVWCNYQQKDVADLYKKLVAISHWTEQDFQREEQYKYEWKSNGYVPDYTIKSFDDCIKIISDINKG